MSVRCSVEAQEKHNSTKTLAASVAQKWSLGCCVLGAWCTAFVVSFRVDRSMDTGQYFVAGAVGGVVEAMVVQPLDMIKTRFHLNPGANPGWVLPCTSNVWLPLA